MASVADPSMPALLLNSAGTIFRLSLNGLLSCAWRCFFSGVNRVFPAFDIPPPMTMISGLRSQHVDARDEASFSANPSHALRAMGQLF